MEEVTKYFTAKLDDSQKKLDKISLAKELTCKKVDFVFSEAVSNIFNRGADEIAAEGSYRLSEPYCKPNG